MAVGDGDGATWLRQQLLLLCRPAGGTILGTSNDHRQYKHHHKHHQHEHHPGSAPASSPSTTSNSSDEEFHGTAVAAASAADRQSDELEHILDKLEFWRINMLLVVGGQGGNQLAAQLADGCRRRRIPCCIVGVPKSNDNDVPLLDKTFGFETVVQVSQPLWGGVRGWWPGGCGPRRLLPPEQC